MAQMLMRSGYRLLLSLSTLFPLFSQPVLAQEFPSKPIRIVTGSGPDLTARIAGKKITEILGQQIIAESIPAGSGKLAAEAVVKSKPDGYTLLNAVPSLIITGAVQGNLPDLSKDFAPVAITNLLPFVLIVAPELQVKTVEEFVRLVKSSPGKINFGSTNGTFPHLAIELFKLMTKTELFHVPYKNVPDTVTALLAGQIQVTVVPYGSVAGLHQSGKLNVLAVTSAERSRVLPNVPTLSESGLPGYGLSGWNGLLAPLGTPPEVIARLNGVIRQGGKDPEIIRQLAAIGNEPGPDFSPEQFAEFLRLEVTKWNKLVKEVGVKMN